MQDIPSEVEITAGIEAPAFNGNPLSFDYPMTRTFVVEDDSYENGIGTWWEKGEVIGVYGNYSKNAKFTSTNSSAAKEVSFRGSLLGTPKYAYYPYDKNNSSSSSTSVKLTMPATHSYHSTFKKLVGDFRAGTLDSRSWFSTTFTFNRLVSIINVSVDATDTDLANSTLQSVKIQVNNKRQITGDFTLNLETQQMEMSSFKEGDDVLTIQWSDAPTLLSNRTLTAYIAALPTIMKGDEIVFTITTNTHVASFKAIANESHVANGYYSFPLVLKTCNDLTVNKTPSEDDDAQNPTSGYRITSMKFEASLNPGKILTRTVKGNTSTFKTTYEDDADYAAECIIDDENQKITLYLPYLNNRKLIPTITATEGAVIAYQGGYITSGKTEVDFSVCKQIAVGNEETGEATFYDVELTNTGLPVVVINQESGTTSDESDSDYKKGSAAWYAATGTKWQPKDSDWEMAEGKDYFMIYYPDGTPALKDKIGNTVSNPVLASTRVRGNVTQQMPKKAFAVKLDSKCGMIDMPAHKRWVLLANWKDRTLMRNEVAFGVAEVFERTLSGGMEWNPSGEFVELVYNGVHVGTYYLCEQIKIDGNRLDINEPYDKDDTYSGDSRDYGYLLEADDGFDETWKFVTANYIPFLFKDDANDEMLTYAQNFIRGIENNLYNGNYTAAYANMDLASFVDFWLVQELMMNSETKHPKSCYFYINEGKMFAGPLWDFDWNTLPTSTSYSEEGYSYSTSMMDGMSRPYHKSSGYPTSVNESDESYLWYPMLIKDNEFKALAAERWNAVKGAISSYVATEIPRIKDVIAKSEAVNSSMWPLDSKSNPKRSSLYGIGSSFLGQTFSCGYCGDEAMSFENAVATMQSTLNTRINGINAFVGNKTWPSISYRTN